MKVDHVKLHWEGFDAPLDRWLRGRLADFKYPITLNNLPDPPKYPRFRAAAGREMSEIPLHKTFAGVLCHVRLHSISGSRQFSRKCTTSIRSTFSHLPGF